jgi:hypothetical protein
MRVSHGSLMTVVLAAIDARRTVAESVARFSEELAGRGEVILVDASRDGTADEAASSKPSLRILRRPVGALAPELWRDGLEASSTPFVAFSTAQMVPRPGWCRRMLDALQTTHAAGVGGSIAPSADLTSVDRALYLLRYASYLPPLPASGPFEPPGDNAVYRRERLDRVAETWRSGFWEGEVHRRLRALGDTLGTAQEAVVEFRGGVQLGSALWHRHAHARHFGATRARTHSLSHRVARTMATPAVPAVLLSRIVRTLRRRKEPLATWSPALPQLALLLSVWSLGETAGAWLGPRPAADRAA